MTATRKEERETYITVAGADDTVTLISADGVQDSLLLWKSAQVRPSLQVQTDEFGAATRGDTSVLQQRRLQTITRGEMRLHAGNLWSSHSEAKEGRVTVCEDPLVSLATPLSIPIIYPLEQASTRSSHSHLALSRLRTQEQDCSGVPINPMPQNLFRCSS